MQENLSKLIKVFKFISKIQNESHNSSLKNSELLKVMQTLSYVL